MDTASGRVLPRIKPVSCSPHCCRHQCMYFVDRCQCREFMEQIIANASDTDVLCVPVRVNVHCQFELS